MRRTNKEEWPRYGEYDAVVCGGGLIGLACAVNLSRSGRRVALVERRGSLGWELTRARRMLGRLPENARMASRCLADLEQAALLGSGERPGLNAPAVELELDRWAMDAEIEVLFHGWACRTTEADGRVNGLIAATREGYVRLAAPLVVETEDHGRLVDPMLMRQAPPMRIRRSCLLYNVNLTARKELVLESGHQVSLCPMPNDQLRADISLRGEDLQSRDTEFHRALPQLLSGVRGVEGCEGARLLYLADEEWSSPRFRLADQDDRTGIVRPGSDEDLAAEAPLGYLLRSDTHGSERLYALASRHMPTSGKEGLLLGGPWLAGYWEASGVDEQIGMVNRVLLGETIAAYAERTSKPATGAVRAPEALILQEEQR